MARFKVKNEANRITVKAILSNGEPVNESDLNLFIRRNLRGFMKPQITGRRHIEYSAPSSVSLYSFMASPVDCNTFFSIILQIGSVYKKACAEKLRLNKIVFDIHDIFINPATKELLFIYLPMDTDSPPPNIFLLIKSVVDMAQPVPGGNNRFISDFVRFLSSLPSYDPVQIESYAYRIVPSVVNRINAVFDKHSAYMTSSRRDYYSHYSPTGGVSQENDAPTGFLDESAEFSPDDLATGILADSGSSDDFEEATGILTASPQDSEDDDDTGTSILSNGDSEEPVRGNPPQPRRESVLSGGPYKAKLVRVRTGQEIRINKSVFRIGKEPSYVDYFVDNNEAVSRAHADVIARGQRFFVKDLNSKNRTFINDLPLPVNIEVEIFDGDSLRLANEDYVFYK